MTLTLPVPWPVNPWPTEFRTIRASQGHGLPVGMEFITVNSPQLGGRGDLAVYTPAAAAGRTDVPLVVLLHGVYGSFWNWSFIGGAHRVLDAAIASGQVEPMVLAMPSDGMRAEGTGYLAHPEYDAERWIIDDVPTCVAERFARRAAGSDPDSVNTDRILLCGNSMGGFGALRLAARFPHRCVAAVGLSPITHLDDLAEFTMTDIGAAASLAADGRDLAHTLATSADMAPFAFDCGTEDPLIHANRAFHERLNDSNIAHDYAEYPGDHSWAHWPDRFAIALRFLHMHWQARR